MVDFKSLVQGAKVVGLIVLAVIGAFATAILGGVVIGVLSNTAVGTWNGSTGGGDITVSSGMKDALVSLEGNYISTISSSVTPLTTIAALVIVVVLITIFFGKMKFGKNGGEGVN